MVSRRKILSRSRDNLVDAQYEEQEEEDVWYNMDKLYKVPKLLYTFIIFILIICRIRYKKYISM
jgi:hypothetical protein